MLTVLGWILDGIELIGSFFIYGLETVANVFFQLLGSVWAVTAAVLPTMPHIGTIGGDWVGWLNWFFPVGQLLDGLAAIVTMWVSFLALRFVLRWLRQV